MSLTIDEATLQAPDSEQSLIGAAGHHPDAIAGVLAELEGRDFYDLVRGQVWDTFRKLSAEREPITPVTVARRMIADQMWSPRAQIIVRTEMLYASPAVHAPRQAEIVADLARRREMTQALKRAANLIAGHPGEASDVLAAVRNELDNIDRADRHDTNTSGPMGWDALVDEFDTVHAPGGSRPGIPSPWWELDDILGGLFGGRVYVFGGRPGQGKSTAALNVAMHAAAESKKQALVVSKEMPSVDVTGRILAAGAEVPLQEINARRLTDTSKARIREYIKRVGQPPITVDARPRSLAGIKTLARAHHHRRGLDVLVVDYLQLVRTDIPSRSREQEVAEVSRQLKELALELDCVVVLPAQLNRESVKRTDPRPNMSDLRDSGQIEADADAIVLLHRERNEKGEPTGQILFIVDKNRHGPTAEISLAWHGGYGAIG
jgi:replicative DNA helicase